MAVFTIPRTVLPPGTRIFGPMNIQDGDTYAALTIDRTIANGLNANAGVRVENEFQQSNDGGSTWFPIGSTGAQGGNIISRFTGLPETSLGVGVSIAAGTARQGRVQATVTGSGSVAVQGTLTTS